MSQQADDWYYTHDDNCGNYGVKDDLTGEEFMIKYL